jgi:hypothetical protein
VVEFPARRSLRLVRSSAFHLPGIPLLFSFASLLDQLAHLTDATGPFHGATFAESRSCAGKVRKPAGALIGWGMRNW